MNKKKIMCLFIIILLIAIVCIINIRNIKIKSVLEFFWEDTDKNMDYLVKKYNQTGRASDPVRTVERRVCKILEEIVHKASSENIC